MAETPGGGTARQELVDVIQTVRKRWRTKLLLRGGIVVLGGALLALALASWGLQALRFSPARALIRSQQDRVNRQARLFAQPDRIQQQTPADVRIPAALMLYMDQHVTWVSAQPDTGHQIRHFSAATGPALLDQFLVFKVDGLSVQLPMQLRGECLQERDKESAQQLLEHLVVTIHWRGKQTARSSPTQEGSEGSEEIPEVASFAIFAILCSKPSAQHLEQITHLLLKFLWITHRPGNLALDQVAVAAVVRSGVATARAYSTACSNDRARPSAQAALNAFSPRYSRSSIKSRS